LHGGACDQSEFARLRDRRAISETDVVLFFNRVQDFLSAAAEEIEIDGQFAARLLRSAAGPAETNRGAFDFEFHHGAEGWCVLVVRDFLLGER